MDGRQPQGRPRLQLFAFKLGYIRNLDRERISKLATHLAYPLDWSQESTLSEQAGNLLDKYSLNATEYILGKARDFAQQNKKKLLVVLFDPYRVLPEMRVNNSHYDQQIVDYLTRGPLGIWG